MSAAGVVELLPLSAEDAALVNREDGIARDLARLAESDARLALERVLKGIQERFFDAIKPVLDKHEPSETDQCRLVHNDDGVLCLEIVRRGRK
jgi:hypothetical protein